MYNVVSDIATIIVLELFFFSNDNYDLRSGCQFHQTSVPPVWNGLDTIS